MKLKDSTKIFIAIWILISVPSFLALTAIETKVLLSDRYDPSLTVWEFEYVPAYLSPDIPALILMYIIITAIVFVFCQFDDKKPTKRRHYIQ